MTDHKDLIERLAWPVNPNAPDDEVTLPAWVLDLCAEARDALEAAPQCVGVKPLEWERSVSLGDVYEVKTIFGEYTCIDNYGIAYGSVPPTGVAWADFDSLEAAKAAAQADYEQRILASITARSVIDVWAEATAAAYGAAADIAHDAAIATEDDGVAAWVRDRIKAQTPQSARDWLADREAAAYRKGQEDMREQAAKSCKNDDFAGDNKIGPGAWASALIRDLPIKEKDDE